MFSTPAYAQTTGVPVGASHGGGPQDALIQFAPFILILGVFYFMFIRPQQQRAKAHQALVAGVKRGDTVVMSSGMIGKATRVDDTEVEVEIAPNVNVKVVKSMISDVRVRGEPVVANDAEAPAPRVGGKPRR